MSTNISRITGEAPKPRGRPRNRPDLIPKSKGATRTSFSTAEKKFLLKFAETGNKMLSLKEAGLIYDKNGNVAHNTTLYQRAWDILSSDEAKKIIKSIQDEIFKQNVHCLEKAVNETFDYYLLLKEDGKHHEANIAHDRYVRMLGLYDSSNKVQVNTQIVAGEKQITINYISPKDVPNDDENNE